MATRLAAESVHGGLTRQLPTAPARISPSRSYVETDATAVTLGGMTDADVNRVPDDLGQPGSFLTLADRTPVYARDGEQVGRVEHVLAEPAIDIFDGIVLDRSRLPGGHRFVDAAHVAEIHERGVLLTIAASEADQLPEPSENPGALRADPAEPLEGELERKLQQAWNLISGRR